MLRHCTLNDVSLASRYLFHHKWAAIAAIVPLALSIGVSVAVFNIARSTILRPLTLPSPEELVMIQLAHAKGAMRRFSLFHLVAMRRASGSRAEVSAYAVSETLLGDRFSQRRVNVALVAKNYFRVLRAAPAEGTLFNEAEKTWGSSPIAILSHQFRQREFGGQSEVVGKEVLLNGRAFKIIGVAKPTFLGLQPTLRHDLYVPLNMKPALTSRFSIPTANWLWLYLFARIPRTQDRQALASLWTVAFNSQPTALRLERSHIALSDAGSGNPYQEQDIRDLVAALAWAGGLILLVAFLSSAGVVSAMEIEDRRRMGIRQVLGATFGDLARIWLTRMMVLAVPAGLTAYAISIVVGDLVVKQYSAAYPERFKPDMTAGWEALTLSLAMSVVISLTLSSLLWLGSRRLDLVTLVHDSSRNTGGSRWTLQSMHTAGQVTLAAALLVAGGIVLRYWSAIENRDLGYRPKGLVSIGVQIDFRSVGGGPGSGEVILRQVFDRLAALPAIRGVSASRFPLLETSGVSFTVRPEQSNASGSDLLGLVCRWVGPFWFKTIGARMIAGREFNEKDGYAAPGVAVVSESFAQRVWPGQSAIGKRLGVEPIHRDVEVIGVVGNLQSKTALENSSPPGLYLSLMQRDETAQTLVLRGKGNANLVLAETRAALQEFGSAVKVLEAHTLEQKRSRILWKQRFYGALVRMIVALALTLAVFGVYSNMRRAFAIRRQELAIRMAVGARQNEMVKLILRSSVALVGTGALLGAALATGGAQIAQSLMPTPFLGARLIVLQPFDPIVLLSAAVVLLALACVAAAAPIREAGRINLAEVLKIE